MKEFNYNSRREIDVELEDNRKKRIDRLSSKSKKLALEIISISEYSHEETPLIDEITNDFRTGKYKKPSEIFKKGNFLIKGFDEVLDVFMPEKYKKLYLYVIDKINQFQYSVGWNRRSVRTPSYVPQIENSLKILNNICGLYLYEDYSISQILRADINDDEKRDYALNGTFPPENSNIIAAAIDLNTENICEAIEDIIMGENNTSVVTVELIRGIAKSDNEHLHKILGDFLLAARLQEGVRQSICENADCGTVKAFITLFDVIQKNDLIRYSSVKRAVSTWIGICDEQNLDRITAKLVALMSQCLTDEGILSECLKTDDAIKINVALWAKGFYDIQNAIACINKILETGTRTQKISASYYNLSLGFEEYKSNVAKYVFESYSNDLEILACYANSYIGNFDTLLREAVYTKNSFGRYRVDEEDKPIVKDIDIKKMFSDENEARKHYDILKKIYAQIPKKEMVYSPCIFEWYAVRISKSEIIAKMCVIAYALRDEEKIDEMSLMLSEVDSIQYRGDLVTLLLTNLKTDIQKNVLVSFLCNRESCTRNEAYKIAKCANLNDENYVKIEDMLKYKSGDMRSNLITLLQMQSDDKLEESVKRLLLSKKEELKTAGLDIIMQVNKEKSRKNCCNNVHQLVSLIESPTEKEQIIIDEIICPKSSELLSTEGYGIYKENVEVVFPETITDEKLIKEAFSMKESEICKILEELDKIIDENKEREYSTEYGTEYILANNLFFISNDENLDYVDRLPLSDIWKKFYNDYVHDADTVIQLNLYLKQLENLNDYTVIQASDKLISKIFCQPMYELKKCNLKYIHHIAAVVGALYSDNAYYDKKNASNNKLFDLSIAIMQSVVERITDENKYCSHINPDPSRYYYDQHKKYSLLQHPYIAQFCYRIENYRTDEEFKKCFFLMYKISQMYKNENDTEVYAVKLLDVLDFVNAYTLNLIPIDTVYENVFKHLNLGEALNILAIPLGKNINRYNAGKFARLIGGEKPDENNIERLLETNLAMRTCKEIYLNIIELILSVELSRGDTGTAFTYCIDSISVIYGCDKLVRILKALGKGSLDRNSYYGYYGYYAHGKREISKQSSLSHLLNICYPNKDDDENTLRDLLKDSKITERRIIETAMYSPQWIDIIEKYLNWDGLKSGCYYFMAHMNERFDDKKNAIIAKYTPLSTEELNDGAFDINWFNDAYMTLGEERFNLLYDSAKYISDGAKHSRARKYADAVTGKFDIKNTEEEILKKRNKDLLMSYSLIPLDVKNKDEDMLRRYKFLQKFLKDSKQFGAQRRASEASAVDISMINLSHNAGFEDTVRLTLKMESMLIKSSQEYFDWKQTGDVEIRIEIDAEGKSEVKCKKGEKNLKSLPSSIKKNEYAQTLNEVHKNLKEQYSRTKKMLEQSMEDETMFFVSELIDMNDNPVVRPLIENLLFLSNKLLGFFSEDKLVDFTGTELALAQNAELRIAHPFDLYKDGHWHEYQKILFDKQIKQPFKQVFRELYVKTEEESEKHNSLRYAGNQIQPQKTAGCLKGRRWVADYENGLQKIYYKENIIAAIYAMADWFSPSDIEAPTLEWVEFSNRKTYEPIKIKDVPDIIFSEIMRDVDMAVSVAHVGGVDPETSHSTIEMRKIIIEFNLPLFKLTNVTFEKTHAIIQGTRGKYSVHLGSGMVHQLGGPQINILPVHSQHRGKIFLPFIDEDPKTAEIMSKIVLLADDSKIKDPYILNQIEL